MQSKCRSKPINEYQTLGTSTYQLMKGNRGTALTIAQKCKNILSSNWQGTLNTIKADAKGSKQEIHSSKVQYFVRKGKPYIWVPEKDAHNTNSVIDERASFAVASPYPGPLASLVRSMKKIPVRTALTGEVIPLSDEKVKSATESLRELVMTEQEAIMDSSYAVSGILSSSTFGKTCRSENLVELLDTDENYVVYKFDTSSCMFINSDGGNHEVDLEDFERTKADKLSPFVAKLIDGINQSEIRRRTLVILCFAFLDVNAKDAYILSVDCRGFDVLAKVRGQEGDYNWKELRFVFDKEVRDVESFCKKLVQMEEKALDDIKKSSGLA